MESTYGDRLHNPPARLRRRASPKSSQRTFDRGGNVVIPSFAVGRTQEMLYFLREIKARRARPRARQLPRLCRQPARHRGDAAFSQDNRAVLRRRGHRAHPPRASTPSPSSACNTRHHRARNPRPSTSTTPPRSSSPPSGMCDAGRIQPPPQAQPLAAASRPSSSSATRRTGTLGPRAHRGREKRQALRRGRSTSQAEIVALEGVSGHADQDGLLRWLDAFETPIERIFVVHGESDVLPTPSPPCSPNATTSPSPRPTTARASTF